MFTTTIAAARARMDALAACLLIVHVASGCRAPLERSGPSRVDLGDVEAITPPTTDSVASAQLTTSSERVIVSWLESGDAGTTLKFAERTSSGWSEPRTVRSAPDLVVNAADVPSVRALADGALVAHWLQEDGPDPEAYTLPLSWSKDGGRTWSPPTTPHHDGTQTQHGFGTSFQAPEGGLGIVWLDGRATSPEAPGGGGDNIGLWSASFDRDGKQTSEAAIAPRACECCQTSVAESSEGAIAAFRGRSQEEVRDIYVTRLIDGHWSSPTLVHADGWKIEGCPINGPAVAAKGRDVAVAWFTAATGNGQAFVAFSHDAGRTFDGPIRFDDGSATGHVDAELLADGSVAVSWTELVNGRSQVRLKRVDGSGSPSPGVMVGTTTGMQYPRLAQGRGELVMTWSETENLFQRVRAARVALVSR